ncbi:MAG: MBOAT family O-acyltransferase, partial [Bacteroidota bacterium]
SEFVPQLYKKFSLTREEFGYAIFLILNGLFKKMILGDYIAVNFIDRVFENPSMYSSFENLMALYGYSLQVYCDFSGYTDIAIGVALLMGFRLPKNFNSPYKATSVGDFWKRWHMSLSSWLKDYLYIPLGGNRSTSVFNLIFIPAAIFIFVMFPDWEWGKFGLISGAFAFWILSMIYPRNHTFDYISMAFLAGLVGYINLSVWYISAFVLLIIFLRVLLLARPSVKQYITTDVNLMMTMLLGGLWHGASTNFIVWGGLNGVGLVVYKLWSKISPYEKKKGMLAHFWKVMLTFNFITFTRIFFRGEDYNRAGIMINKITSGWDFSIIPDILWSYKTVFLLMLFGYIIHWLPGSFKESYRGWFIKTPVYVKATVTAMVVFAVYQAISADMQPFIYFQF